MALERIKYPNNFSSEKSSLLIRIFVLWGAAAIILLAFLWSENDLSNSKGNLYLLPWAFLAGICVLSPSIYFIYKGKFDLFHPLVFAAWSYIFPALVIGAVIIAFDGVSPYFLTFIEDQRYNLPLTLIYISVGFLGLTAGYFLPIGQILSTKIERWLPTWDWKPENVWLSGIVLLLVGVGFNILGFVQGLLGFQRSIDVSVFDGVLFFLVVILTEGTVLLWLAIFSVKEKAAIYYVTLVVLILFLPIRMALMGNRGSLLGGLIPIAMAFVYSGRKLKIRTAAVFAVMGLVALFIGVIYGTTFRNIKGSEARIGAGDYIGQIGATIEYLSTEDVGQILAQSAQALADRVENLSSVGVVVANYEKLAPYEASYGLENNIINDALTSFVPRFIWADKPQTSDARAYSDLYFNYSENSFASTPFADLLRNFGPVGIPIGMMILGIYLRTLYSTLIDTPTPSLWKKVAYFPLLTVVSYESFYATIFPSTVRILFVVVISLYLVNFLVKKSKGI